MWIGKEGRIWIENNGGIEKEDKGKMKVEERYIKNGEVKEIDMK